VCGYTRASSEKHGHYGSLFRACARIHKSHDKTEPRAIVESQRLEPGASAKFNTKEKAEEEDDTAGDLLRRGRPSSMLSAVYGLLACFRIILIRWRRGRR